jgi:hypothetical protein
MIFLIPAVAALVIVFASIWGFRQDKNNFLEHWAPALITGLFLIGILPIANEIYWKRQKDYEICVQDREKRYSLIGSTAKTFTNIFKIHTRLYELAKEVSQEEKVIIRQGSEKAKSDSIREIHTEHLKELNALKSNLQRELIQLQSQLGSDSAVVARYLPAMASHYFNAAKAYDDRVSKVQNFLPNPTDPLVKEVNKLIELMATEAQRNENACG